MDTPLKLLPAEGEALLSSGKVEELEDEVVQLDWDWGWGGEEFGGELITIEGVVVLSELIHEPDEDEFILGEP